MPKVTVTVEKIIGQCRTHKVGQKLVFVRGKNNRMFDLDMEASDGKRICVHALNALFPFLFADRTWNRDPNIPADFYRCPDPGPELEGGGGRGSVVFRVQRESGSGDD